MKSIQKRYLIYWVNILFLIVNTALFVFMFLDRDIHKASDAKMISNEFLKEELGLSEGQYQELCVMDAKIQQRYQRVLKLLCHNRYMLMSELAQPQPSADRLNELAKAVGYLHTALKRQTSWHLLNIKKICNPEQSIKLEKIFREILELDTHCEECRVKCSKKEKCNKSATFCPYREHMEDSLKEIKVEGSIIQEKRLSGEQ